MTPRYTFKDLRIINRLNIEELSCKTLIPSETLEEIEIDSSDIEYKVLKTLVEFYCIASDYIFIGKQSDFEVQQLDEMVRSTPLPRRLSILEVAKLEEVLGITAYSLARAVLELSKEVDNEHLR